MERKPGSWGSSGVREPSPRPKLLGEWFPTACEGDFCPFPHPRTPSLRAGEGFKPTSQGQLGTSGKDPQRAAGPAQVAAGPAGLVGAMRGGEGSPSASGWGPAKDEEQAGHRARATTQMPQVGALARPSSLDPEKGSWGLRSQL